MAWIYLLLASFCEIIFAGCLKLTGNFTNVKWSVLFVFFYILSVVLLNKAVQTLPLGTAYAVWTGIGTAGTAILAMFLFNEPVTISRIVFLSMIVLGILGLKVTH